MKNAAKYIFIVSTLVIFGLGVSAWRANYSNRTSSLTPTPVTTTVSAAITPSPALADPILIDAIRARAYPGSAITRQQTLAVLSGYTNYLVSYQSDGLKINALMSIPHGTKPASGWPVIIFDHGYIDPAAYQTNGPEYTQFIASLAGAGYVVIKPDYRGHGQSQGVPEGGHFSPVYAYDQLNLIASIKQTADLDPKRIGQLAHSLGGHVALRTAVVSKDIKATSVMAGVVGSFYDLLYNWPNSPMPNDKPAIVQANKQTLLAKFGDPKTNPSFWNGASAVNYVKDIVGPVQVNQDVADSVVPKLFADHLVSALQTAGKAVEYKTYPGNDHQFATNRSAVMQNVLAFFKANL